MILSVRLPFFLTSLVAILTAKVADAVCGTHVPTSAYLIILRQLSPLWMLAAITYSYIGGENSNPRANQLGVFFFYSASRRYFKTICFGTLTASPHCSSF